MTSTRRSVDPDPDAVPHSYLRANTVHFDLTQLSAVIRERLSAEDAVIGFGTTYSDDVFLRKLCERVSYIIGRSLTKDPVSLRPDLRTPQGCIDDLWHYQEDLHRVNVLCVVRADAIVDEAFDSAVAEFWDLAHRAFSKIPQRLILTIVAQPGARFPGGITELPPPRFTQHDVWSWVNDIAHEIEAARGWSLDLREAWNEMLCRSAKSADTASSLDARRLYQAMDQSIRELQIDPEGLRHKLEEVHRDRSAH